MPNKFKLARVVDGAPEDMAYSFETETECLATPAYTGAFIIERGDDLPGGWRVAYFGAGKLGEGKWDKPTQAETVVSPIITGE